MTSKYDILNFKEILRFAQNKIKSIFSLKCTMPNFNLFYITKYRKILQIYVRLNLC